MTEHTIPPDAPFEDVRAALHRGDFSWLAPVFEALPDEGSALARWVIEGRFDSDPSALNEAVTCACFLGRNAMVDYLMRHGADPIAGAGTGMNGFHWAANRGQLDTVKLLIARNLPMELRNNYGGTVLDCTVWSSVHEPRGEQVAIVEALLQAGADVKEAEYPSGSAAVDKILQQYR